MGAKNKVISGDYKDKNIVATSRYAVIPLGFTRKIILDENTVASYKVIDGDKTASATSAITRGAVGSLLLGPVGLLAGLSAKKKGVYTISINFSDGKQSLIEVNEKIYKSILSLSLLNEKTNDQSISREQTKEQDILGQIEKLGQLKEKGILTEEEFLTKKSELLAKL